MTSAAITHSDIYISGDVRIDPRAVIAPGVILQAAADSYIAIAAGVCIGVGAILQAHQGNIEIHSGAIVGAGTLIIGKAQIGENACIGYGTTIFRASIVAATIVPPNALVGDVSRQTTGNKTTATKTFQSAASGTQTTTTFDPWQENSGSKIQDPIPTPPTPVKQPVAAPPPKPPTPVRQPVATPPPKPPTPVRQSVAAPPPKPPEDIPAAVTVEMPEVMEAVLEPEIMPKSLEAIEEAQVRNRKVPVVGQVYINQLLTTLFPHQNSIKPIDTSLNP